jgi:hypothetical protein
MRDSGQLRLLGVPEAARAGADQNRLADSDRPIHDWYRFVLSFPSHLVREYASQFELASDSTVLDPFCGTGTVLVEAKKLGIRSIGIEAHPMAHLAATVKTDWALAADGLRRTSEKIAESANRTLESGDPVDLRQLPSEAQRLLIDRSISPLPLHKALVLVEAIRAAPSRPFMNHQLLALAKILPTQVGNLRFGPEVGTGSIKQDAPVVGNWLSVIQEMACDIDQWKHMAGIEAVVLRGDAREAPELPGKRLADAVITSPPYPNEKDYTRATRLESVVLGLVNNKAELREVKHGLLRSNTRNVYSTDEDHRFVAGVSEIETIAAAIEDRRIALGKTSGFERQYARVTKLYFGGMVRHLIDLRPRLRRGALLAYVVGDQASYLQVMIRTGQILANLAERCGYEVISVDLFRTRFATATQQQLREEVVVLRWPG